MSSELLEITDKKPLPRVYISVLNWNNSSATIACLESLDKLDYPDYVVLVVDNASADDSVSRISAAFPNIEIIRASDNLGYAGGNQLALQRALQDKADLFWILNNDTLVQQDALAQLVTAYSGHGEALYSSIPLDSPELTPESLVPFPRKFLAKTYKEEILTRRRPSSYRELFPDNQDRIVGALPGTCLLIPISVVRKYGFIDTSFFMYSEEIDYCLRLGRQGVPCYVIPSSIVYHSGKGSSKGNYHLEGIISYYIIRNRLIRTHRYESNPAIFSMIACLGILQGLAKLIYLPRQGKKALWLAYCNLSGVLAGVAGKTGKTFKPEDYIRESL